MILRTTVVFALALVAYTTIASGNALLNRGPVRLGTIAVRNAASVPVHVEILENGGGHGLTPTTSFCLLPGAARSKDTFSSAGINIGDLRFQVRAQSRVQGCDSPAALATAQTPVTGTADYYTSWTKTGKSGPVRNIHEIIVEGNNPRALTLRVITSTKMP